MISLFSSLISSILSKLVLYDPSADISTAPIIQSRLNAVFIDWMEGLVTYGNLKTSYTPKDFNCNKVCSNGVLRISGSLYSSNLENKAVE